jgi:hypothetical protein
MGTLHNSRPPFFQSLYRVILHAGLAALGLILLAVLAFAAHGDSGWLSAMAFAFVFAAVVSVVIRLAFYVGRLALELNSLGRRAV